MLKFILAHQVTFGDLKNSQSPYRFLGTLRRFNIAERLEQSSCKAKFSLRKICILHELKMFDVVVAKQSLYGEHSHRRWSSANFIIAF